MSDIIWTLDDDVPLFCYCDKTKFVLTIFSWKN